MIKINSKDCTGCRICEIVCSMHHYRVVNSERARVRVTTNWPWEDEPVLCRQCRKPKCVESCPRGALAFANNHPVLDAEKCNSCQACVAACPFKAMFVDPENGMPIPCDTCDGKYMCSQWCPNKVIEVVGE
ncbi:MAG: 4Fe-4S dicluster domain-containing protein [Firmicutes bacterium]|nr:4Fe-4S dicluster domain-containing protein [Bacillota bacterium]